MTLDLTCQACDTSFDIEAAELLDEPRLQCPSCEARVPRAAAEALSGALEELFSQVSRLQPKFQLVVEVSSEDLPPPYDRERPAADDDDTEEEDVDDAGGELGRHDED